MDVRSRSDHEIESSAPRLSTATDDSCCESSPLACDRRVDGERVERGLDDAEPLRPSSSLVLRAGNENAEVQLGEGGCADRSFELTGALCTDENGGIEEHSQLLGEGVCDLGRKPREIVVERLGCRCLPDALQCASVDPLARPSRPEARDRTARNGNGELLAGLSSPQHLADVVA